MSKRHRNNDTQPRQPRPSKLDMLALAVTQDVTHLATADILRKRNVIQCELDATDSEIAELSLKISAARQKRQKIVATFAGMNDAISRRQICD